MTARYLNQQRILEFDFDDHNEAVQRRLCLEVPCVVNLSHCNVIVWFERQVEQKLQNNAKWRVYHEDQQRTAAFLQRRGVFLYDKYLAPLVANLRTYNRRLLRYIVWRQFPRNRRRPEDDADSELSINTIFDTSSLLGRSQRSSLSQESTSMSIVTPASYQFEYDLDKIITSTQRSEEEEEEFENS